MRIIIVSLFISLLSSMVYAEFRLSYKVVRFETQGAVAQRWRDHFLTSFAEELSKRNFFPAEDNPENLAGLDPDFVFDGVVRYEPGDSRYNISLHVINVRNKLKQWRDTVYTMDIWSDEGAHESASALAERFSRLSRGVKVGEYRELKDYRKKYNLFSSTTNVRPDSMSMINFISLTVRYPYGFDLNLPTQGFGFGLEFFHYAFGWFLPDLPLGLGIGTDIADIKGPEAGSFLPLYVYIPIYVFPSDYEYNRKDIMIVGEWGPLIPKYSFIDVSLKAIYNGLTLSVGWLYLPPHSEENYTRKETSTIYASISLYFGNYQIEWAVKETNK